MPSHLGPFLGLMLCIQTLSQRQILFVSQCVSVDHFEDEMTCERSPRVQVVWVLVVFKLFRQPLLPARCSRSVFPVLGIF